MRKLLFILVLSYLLGSLSGQDSIPVISGALLEDLIENNDEQTYDFYSLYEELQTYLDNPLNLNTASADDLRGMGLFNDVQVVDILNHREKYGDFLSQYELQSIPSMDFGTLTAVMPFVSAGGGTYTKNLGQLFKEGQHTTVLKYRRTLQEKRGYTDDASSPYLGNPDQYYVRYNMNSGRNLRLGLTMEKDAGEEFFAGSNRQGFDYYSAFVFLKDVHPVFRVVNIGDYTISMGQGLILNNNFGGNKTAFVMDVKQGGNVIRPYSSVNEFNYFRGVATSLHLHDRADLTVFGSFKRVDGTLVQTDTIIETGFGTFSSFAVNGLHRTASEIAKEGTVEQTSGGAVLKLDLGKTLKVNFNALHNRFSQALNPSGRPYQRFAFRGNQLTNMSMDYTYRYQNFSFFGEVARSDNGGTAQVHGSLISLGRYVDAAVVYRNYEADYQVLNANAFGESSQPINEQGVYFALLFKPYRSITVSTYFDVWRHPWLRSNAGAPSEGREFLAKIEYNKKRKYNVYLQYRFEQKTENSSLRTEVINPIVPRSQHRARLNFAHTYSKELSLISRLEYNHFNKDNESSQGWMIFQDVKYKPIGKPYSFAARYMVFDTDNTNTRIYAFENDVLYEFSIPFFSGSGTRFYVKGQYRIDRNMYVQLRYSRTYFDNEEDIFDQNGIVEPFEIGSGNERILGNLRSDLKAVIRYKF